MGLIPDEIIEQVRDRTDVAELVGRTVTLKRAGRNHKGLCPFHDEKTPSFNVNPDRRSYYCFGCQEGGDVFSFLMKTEGLSFAEAVRTLAKDCGIEIPESESGERGLSDQLFEANEVAQAHYRASLAEVGNPGLAYLAKRGFDVGGLDAERIERFGVGFAPDRWDSLVHALRKARVPAELAERAGLLASRESGGHYDRLRGRVIFPIRDPRGRVIGFGGRAVDSGQEPKYLNTPESPVFRKREAFYGFPHALEGMRRHGRAVLVEGYFDWIALQRAGIEGALATCGTALTADHARQLKRRVDQVVLLFDGDEAGQRAVERALEVLLPEGLRVRAVLLPAGEDPDDFLTREGDQALRDQVDAAPAALDLVIGRAVAKGTATPWDKADAVARVVPLLSRVSSAVERAEFANRLALSAGTEVRHVEAAMRSATRGEDPREAIPVAARRTGPEERNLRQIARCLLEHPKLVARVPHEELGTLLGEGPLCEVVVALAKAAAQAEAIDVEDLAEQLSEAARADLRALAMSEGPLEEDAAELTLDDTLRWLRRRRRKEKEQALTRLLRDPNADTDAVLEEKQRLLSEREPRTGREPDPHPPVGSSL